MTDFIGASLGTGATSADAVLIWTGTRLPLTGVAAADTACGALLLGAAPVGAPAVGVAAGCIVPAGPAGGTRAAEALGAMTWAVAGLGRVMVIMLPL